MINWLRVLAFSGVTALIVTSSPAVMAVDKADPFHNYMAVWRGCEVACRGFQDYFRDNKFPAKITIRDAGRDKFTVEES